MKAINIVIALVSMLLMIAWIPGDKTEYVPKGWPEPQYDFSSNPLDSSVVAWGRLLFHSPLLSRDKSVSCSSCHLSYTAFTHTDHSVSHGVEDRLGKRNSIALMNLAWQPSFMWDGAVHNLEVQALAPIHDSLEMDFSLFGVLERLNASERHRALCASAYGDEEITEVRFLKALTQFQLTFVTDQSRYDRMLSGEIQFTEQEQRGYELFQINCSECHQEPLLSHYGFEVNGLPMTSEYKDVGRQLVTGLASDSMKFKVPTLRNVEFSGPYMHDGRFKNLKEVIEFYNHAVVSGTPVLKQKLSEYDKVDLLSFLLTTTDESFLFNTNYTYPKE